MRVVIDCRYAFPHLSGIGRYAVNLVRGLVQRRRVRVVALTGVAEDLERYLEPHPWIEVVQTEGSPRGIEQQVWLPRLLGDLGADVFHSPDAFAPLVAPCRTVITIHDVIPLAARGGRWGRGQPSGPGQWKGGRQRESQGTGREEAGAVSLKARVAPAWAAWQRLQCLRAARVLTTTQYSASDIRKHLHVDPAKLRVVNPGIASPPPVLPAEIDAVRRRLGLSERYVLFVGRREPYKNLLGLVRALGVLRDEMPDLKLVAVGHADTRFPEPEQEAARLGLRSRLVVTGHVSEADVEALYAGAAAAGALALVSFYEGFGYPPLEALARGVPVVASRLTSLPEVLGAEGDGVVYADAADPHDIARALRLALHDKSLRDSLRAGNSGRLARFSLERQADETTQVYEEALATPA